MTMWNEKQKEHIIGWASELKEFTQICEAIERFFQANPDKRKIWWHLDNPFLNELSPYHILNGLTRLRNKKILNLIHKSIESSFRVRR